MALPKIFYFAFGSNLLKERILINKTTKFTFKCIGKLNNWRLTFCEAGGSWGGGSADIQPQEGCHIWGVAWEIDTEGVKELDLQEGVEKGLYEAIHVDIETLTGEKLHCRSYRMLQKVPKPPSRHYKEVIVRGAEQHHLPKQYIEQLKKVVINDFEGDVPLYNELASKWINQ